VATLTGRSAIVLGAGLQGTTVAFALAEAGFRVTVVDEAGGCLERASLRNEGKIHLGFVYAHDSSRRTSSLMLESALAFGPLLEGWLGAPLDWREATTGPFSYLILTDSLVDPAELLDAWEGLQATFDRLHGGASSYLGERLSRLWSVPAEPGRARLPFTDRVSLVVRTVERAVNPESIRRLVHARLDGHDRISARHGHRVRTVRRTSNGFQVDATNPDGETWTLQAPVVVNCLWDGRLAIDREMGVLPRRPWVYRLKYRLLGRLPDRLWDLPSVTMMLGRFGDLVNFGDGRVYLSWYPTCLGGWSSEVVPPDRWSVPCVRGVPVPEASELIERTLAAFDEIVPGLRECRIDSVAAGIIFSWGATDIDDLNSELHQRHEIGPALHDGYVTVNTGKLTSAPLFARAVRDLVG
jgi:glycine/D-amino acid oxidase-like deaminating enzyme